MKGRFTKSLILLAAIGLVMPIYAAPTNGMVRDAERGMHRGFGIEMILSKLDLTPEQEAKITELQKKQMLKRFDNMQEMRKLRDERMKLNIADTPNKSAAYSIIDKITSLHANTQKDRFDFFEAVKSVLTPEQIKKLNSMRDDFRGKINNRDRNFRDERGFGRHDNMRHSGNQPGMPGAMNSKMMGMHHDRDGFGPGGMGFGLCNQDKDFNDEDMQHGFHGMMFEGLDLTEAQEKQITALRREQVLIRFDHRQAMKEVVKEKHALMLGEDVDRAAMFNLIDKEAKLKAEGMKQAYDHIMKMRAILTPEQIEKVKAFRQQRHDCKSDCRNFRNSK
ncbi:MAG: Spy/CpxP family protein refolding chaperone [Acidobacteria bacterium]|nr:Spy/CpxP family protein refolding chaperone [Acidobacteriota bacterium]